MKKLDYRVNGSRLFMFRVSENITITVSAASRSDAIRDFESKYDYKSNEYDIIPATHDTFGFHSVVNTYSAAHAVNKSKLDTNESKPVESYSRKRGQLIDPLVPASHRQPVDPAVEEAVSRAIA